jgi:NMD protein affecting ribosome stability and mRNA decay
MTECEGWNIMPIYCSVCGEELEPEDEEEGICRSCKLAASGQTITDNAEP